MCAQRGRGLWSVIRVTNDDDTRLSEGALSVREEKEEGYMMNADGGGEDGKFKVVIFVLLRGIGDSTSLGLRRAHQSTGFT